MRRAGQYVMFERREESRGEPGRDASLKSRTMSVATGTLEDENYQAAVTPSEAEGSKALRPQPSCASQPPPNRSRMSVRIGAPGDGTSALCYDGALDFSTPLEKTFSYQRQSKGAPGRPGILDLSRGRGRE